MPAAAVDAGSRWRHAFTAGTRGLWDAQDGILEPVYEFLAEDHREDHREDEHGLLTLDGRAHCVTKGGLDEARRLHKARTSNRCHISGFWAPVRS